MSGDQILEQFFSGSRRALARLISAVENERGFDNGVLNAIYAKVGRAYRLGVTGPPGAGKSTFVDQVAKLLRQAGKTVGIIAVDPSSPFTGGALLGDRVRMGDLTTDTGVFIRSMATRGSLGGLSRKAREAGDVLDAFGKDFVIFETVGVGQSELDIVETADTVVVILVPESGDAIQAMKAGLMEIADIFVMNKSDRDGATRALRELEAILHLRPAAAWNPPVIATVAATGEGMAEFWEMLEAHRDFLRQGGRLEQKRKARLEKMIRELVGRRLRQELWDEHAETLLRQSLDSYRSGEFSPYQLADELVDNFKSQLLRAEHVGHA